MRTGRTPWALTIAALLSLAIACERKAAEDPLVARPDAKRYELKGNVVSVKPAERIVAVDHEAIPDYMDAMTMEFVVKQQWALSTMKPGDQVRATLVVDGAKTWLEDIAVTGGNGSTAATAPRGSWVPAAAGTPLPKTPLVDQDEKTFSLDRFHGQPLLLTFSFTRCPLPDYCPLMMQNFATLERATAKDAALARTRLLTVSIDPTFDTPAVLKKYGEKYVTGDGQQQRFARWTLATGKPEDIKQLAGFFGLDYFEEKDRIIHSLRTAVVDGEGRLVKVFEGNEWTVEDVMRTLRNVSR